MQGLKERALAEGIVGEGRRACGAIGEGSIGDEFLESLDDAVAGDLNGAVSAGVVNVGLVAPDGARQ